MTPPHSRPHATALSPPYALLLIAAIALLSIIPSASAAAEKKPKPLDPCTIRSPSTHAFFDLNPIAKHPPTEKDYAKHKDDPDWEVTSYHAKGYDYGANFTINFCAPVVENLQDVKEVDESLWKNVSAFYVKGGLTYSIGLQNSEPVFRGRKLVLNYTDGSPCPGSSHSFDRRSYPAETLRRFRELRRRDALDHDLLPHEAEELERAKHDFGTSNMWDDDDDDDGWHRPSTPSNSSTSHDGIRRKSTILSLLCEKDPLAPKAAVSFVGSMDECTYFFEVRSLAACAGVETADQSLGPGGVFGVIAMIAVMVYIIGGCVYQRTVMHQRGWRQLPNYNLWSTIWDGVKDCMIILTSSCSRYMPGRRGYSRVSGVSNGYGRGRNNHSDDENRLIDQLDEEWDD